MGRYKRRSYIIGKLLGYYIRFVFYSGIHPPEPTDMRYRIVAFLWKKYEKYNGPVYIYKQS